MKVISNADKEEIGKRIAAIRLYSDEHQDINSAVKMIEHCAELAYKIGGISLMRYVQEIVDEHKISATGGMTERDAMLEIKSLKNTMLNDARCTEAAMEAQEMAYKALEEIHLYKSGGLCLVPVDVFKRQCEQLDRYREQEGEQDEV